MEDWLGILGFHAQGHWWDSVDKNTKLTRPDGTRLGCVRAQ